ncbi:MAG: paraquat-inducible protein A [Phycisphaerales bacterium]
MSIVTVDPEASCPRCGEWHRLPTRRGGRLHRCTRCGERIVGDAERRLARQRVKAFSLASLVLYPLAIGLPIMTLAQFGHARSTSVIGGVSTLWSEGHPILATVVAACSVVLPLAKCLAMLGLSLLPGDPPCSRRSRRRRAPMCCRFRRCAAMRTCEAACLRANPSSEPEGASA